MDESETNDMKIDKKATNKLKTKPASKEKLVKRKLNFRLFLLKNFPEIMLIALCMILLGVGVSRKEGFHMDELLSFELSNAEFTPWIVPTQPEGRLAKFVKHEIEGESLGETVGNLVDTVKDVLQNRGSSKLLSYQADVYQEPVWITGEQFTDYITVDGGDDFNYLSVYFNVKDDNHPPLHFMLLHTISSIFKRKAVPVMGCIINMACVAVSMVFLMKVGELLAAALGMEEKGRLLGLLAALLYGCSTGAMATTLLIRMYGLVTCFCVSLFYLHVKKWLSREFTCRNRGMIVVTILGFWTQYFFLFYCLLLAAVTAVLLVRKKRFRELGIYIRSMVIAAVIGVVGFPFAISDVFSSGRGVEALNNLADGLAGYGNRLLTFGKILSDRCFGGVLVIVAVVLLLFILWVRRRKKVESKLSNTIAESRNTLLRREAELGNARVSRERAESEETAVIKAGSNKAPCLWLLLLPVAGYFLLSARMSPYLVDRYIMPLFPFVMLAGALLLVGMAYYLERKSGERNILLVVCSAVVIAQLWQLLHYDGSYLYQGYEEQLQVAESYEGYPCICVYDGVGYYENLPEFTHYGQALLVKQDELANRQDTQSITSLEQVVVLLKVNADREAVTEILLEAYGFTLKEELLTDGVHGDTILLFETIQSHGD